MLGSHLPALQSAATPSTAPQSSTASTPDHKATNPKRARTQAENWDKGQWNWQQTGWRDQSLSQQVSGDELRGIVAQLTRLVLRHEDTEAATRVDSGFQLYMDTSGDLAMLPRLYSIAMDWKKKKTENPDQLKQSLRVTIFLCVMMELKSRAETALGDTMRPVLQKNGWITTADPPSWGYQKWDPEQSCGVGSATDTASSPTGSGAPGKGVQAERTPGHDPQVPLHKADGARVQVRDLTLHPSHLQPRGGIQRAAQHPIGALRLLPATPCGPSHASDALEEATARNIAGAVSKQTAGSHSLEGKGSTKGDDRSASQQRPNAGPRPVLQPLQLYLSNPHNLCYSNAVFIGLHRVGRSLSTSTEHEPSMALGRLQPLLAMLHRGTQHRPIYTPNLLGFQLIFQNFPGLSSMMRVSFCITASSMHRLQKGYISGKLDSALHNRLKFLILAPLISPYSYT